MRRYWLWAGVGLCLVIAGVLAVLDQARAAEIAADFERTWERADRPIAEGRVSRSWTWGPGGHSGAFYEPYADSPGGERLVQYTDKSRMEINDPTIDSDAMWFVTNGLLARELITGRLQTGDATFEQRQPARVHVAGDEHADSPTYASFNQVLEQEPTIPDDPVIQTIDRAGDTGVDHGLESYGVTGAFHAPDTNHTIASVFWDFMQSRGEVYEDGEYVVRDLFQDPFFVVGFPITEAYWMSVPVAGEPRDVLAQCFERRCLTYTPSNPDGWRVEAGNIGQHYYAWRYDMSGEPPDGSDPPDDLAPPDDDALGPPVAGTCEASPQSMLISVADSLGNVNSNSWAKGTGGDWPDGIDTSPVVEPGQEITLTATAQSECEPLEFRFQRYREEGETELIRGWSESPEVTYTFSDADADLLFLIVDVRDQDPRSHFDGRDDYTYLTYSVQ